MARWILECLSLSSQSPPLAPATAFGLGPVIDYEERELPLSEPELDPGFDFDQSQANDQDSNQGS